MKAILVIDMPSSCIECRYSLLGGCYCTLTQEDLIVNDGDISENCPLKPMPKRKIVGEIEKVDDFMKSDIQIINEKVTAKIMLDTELLLASGYNLCIDEILGEEE